MKKFLLLFLLISSNSFSQEGIKFKNGVKTLILNKIPEYQAPKTILFEFKGHTHLIHHFLGLSKKIKKRFKRKGIKVNFNYKLTAKKPWKNDLKHIPSIKYNLDEYEAVCFFEIKNFKTLKTGTKGVFIEHIPKEHQSQLSHEVNVKLKKKGDNLLTSKLVVKSYSNISTENKKISKTLKEIIIN